MSARVVERGADGARFSAPAPGTSVAARRDMRSYRWAWPVAMLLAAVSLGGLVSPAYARETPAWTAQAVGQDWFDVLIAAPWIAVCGIGARGGSYRWTVLLAGAYAYTVYELAIYAFAVHFNALFLVYCATLGVAAYALVATTLELAGRTAHVDRRGARVAGGFLVGVGVAFALLWLAEDVPALLRGAPPASLDETGLATNPVHVMDLSVVLPAHVLAGAWLWKRRRAGELLGPIVLAFGVVMSASIAGMLLAIRVLGGDAPAPVAVAIFAICAATAVVLARVLSPVSRSAPCAGSP